MAPPLSPTVYTGTFIHTPTLGAVEVLRNAAIGVNEHGVIVSIMQDLSPEDLKKGVVAEGEKSEGRWKVSDLGAVGEGKWWFPGFVGESGLLLFRIVIFVLFSSLYFSGCLRVGLLWR